MGWSRLAGEGLEIRHVPGNHITLIQEPHVRELAEQLEACLQRAQAVGVDRRDGSAPLVGQTMR